jgi:hypothetical protein
MDEPQETQECQDPSSSGEQRELDPAQQGPAWLHRVEVWVGKHLFWLGFVSLAAITLSIYHPAIQSGLLSDDWGLSYPDPFSEVLASFHGHWFGGGEGTFYRPLSRVLIWLEARVFGYGGTMQHLVSLALFLASAFLVSWKVREFRGDTAALLTAAFILLNPLYSESVSWVSSQTDLLAGLFLVATFFVVLKPLEKLGVGRILLSFVFAVLAYLSKDSSAYLGPLFVVYGVVYVLIYGPRRLVARRGFLVLLGGQLVLWVLYLICRRVFLGSFAPTEEYVPLHGWFWQRMVILHNVLREYVTLVIGWFSGTQDLREFGPSMLWLFLLAGGFLVFLLLRRQYVVLGLSVGFLTTLIPLFTSQGPYFLDETLEGSRRYFHNANFLAAGFLGCLVPRKTEKENPLSVFSTAAVFVLVLLFAQLASRTVDNAVEWGKAGQLRDEIAEQIEKKVEGVPKAVLVLYDLPDHVQEAYVFRSGVREFLTLNWPDLAWTWVSDLRLDKIDPNAAYFVLKLDKQGRPDVEPYAELDALRKNQQLTASGEAKATPILFDFSNKTFPKIPLFPSDDIHVLDRKDDPLLVEITGRDPHIALEWPEGVSPAIYKTFRIRFEYVEVPSSAPSEDQFQVLWKAPYDSLASPPLISHEVEVRPGIQEISFALGGNPRWLSNQTLEWFRVDLGTRYRGRMRIHLMAFE